MGFFDSLQHNFKAFIHSVTTDDHYASYDSPYKHNTINSSSSRLNELNRIAQNNSSTSLNGPVPYRPGMRSTQSSHPNADVQLQDYVDGQPPLPTIDSIWEKLDEWYENEYPELGDNLNYGATVADLNEMENDLNCTLPLDVRQSYQFHDGQIRGGKPTGAIMGLTLLDIEGIVEEYSIWLKVSRRIEKQQYLSQTQSPSSASSSSNPNVTSRFNATANMRNSNNIQSVEFANNQKAYPVGAIQNCYSHQGWIPLVKDWAGNNVAVDLAPGPTGRWGQIILFGRDFDVKFVIANSWNEFLFRLLQDFEEGRFVVDEIDEELLYNDKRGSYSNYIDVLRKRAMTQFGVFEKKDKTLPKLPLQSKFDANKLDSRITDTNKMNNTIVEENLLPKETLIDDEEKEDEPLVAAQELPVETESIETIKPKTIIPPKISLQDNQNTQEILKTETENPAKTSGASPEEGEPKKLETNEKENEDDLKNLKDLGEEEAAQTTLKQNEVVDKVIDDLKEIEL